MKRARDRERAQAVESEAAGGTTWDPATDSTASLLSNGNMTLSSTTDSGSGAVFSNARTTTSKNTGKLYVEFAIVDPIASEDGNVQFGLVQGAVNIGDGENQPSNNNNDTASVWINQFGADDPGSFRVALTGNRVFRLAADLDTAEFWLGDSAGWFVGDPAAGTGPPVNPSNNFTTPGATMYLAGSLWGLPARSITLRTATEDFQYAVPAGFSAWDA